MGNKYISHFTKEAQKRWILTHFCINMPIYCVFFSSRIYQHTPVEWSWPSGKKFYELAANLQNRKRRFFSSQYAQQECTGKMNSRKQQWNKGQLSNELSSCIHAVQLKQHLQAWQVISFRSLDTHLLASSNATYLYILRINMTTSSRTCPVPTVNGHMNHYPTAPYPLLFPPVIGGLSLPSLHGLQSHPPTSGCSTPSPASKCPVIQSSRCFFFLSSFLY